MDVCAGKDCKWHVGYPSSAEADAFALSSLDAINRYSRTVEKLARRMQGLKSAGYWGRL